MQAFLFLLIFWYTKNWYLNFLNQLCCMSFEK